MQHLLKLSLLLIVTLNINISHAAEAKAAYTVNAGDVLEISVWKEEELQREIRVLPDGYISFPLVGELAVSGVTLTEIREQLVKKLSKYITDPVVNISVKSSEGNSIYVIGQVQRPGSFMMHQPLDVMQALSLAGGLTTFAKANDIRILRRTAKGPTSIEFEYGELEDGDELESNIVLKSGDVIVVP
ncbi:MAG: polysaccharide biosynthesis/export family protein [Methyloprofundus sp.]|nr:polysaccharide biosynthesis/export family protein [Methyloprofundus sp.]